MSELGSCVTDKVGERSLAVAPFRADATPPLGSPLNYGASPAARKIVDPLSARGLVLFGDSSPIVLCAVDWVAIGNTGHDAWREALADAAGTTVDRVAVHVVHQHDAPACDFLVEELMAHHNLAGRVTDVTFHRAVMGRAAKAVREATKSPQRVTHVGLGKAKVDRVASNRRVLGPDGKVEHIRFSSCRNPAAIAAAEGVVDPYVRLVSFWNGDRPITSITYYATHPQSFYGQGAVSADFVGLARGLREASLPDVEHIHFNGAAGNVAAGKYNDGSPARRFELANRLAEGMRQAWESAKKVPISAADLEWRVQSVTLPIANHLDERTLLGELEGGKSGPHANNHWTGILPAIGLAWLRRCQASCRIDLACLRIGSAYVLHMPGELFVEYQLAAQQMRPGDFVCMAACGDFGPGYIGTQIAYSQGGYETKPSVSRVAPEVEPVLMSAMRKLLR